MKHIRLIIVLSFFCMLSACASGIKYTEYQPKYLLKVPIQEEYSFIAHLQLVRQFDPMSC